MCISFFQFMCTLSRISPVWWENLKCLTHFQQRYIVLSLANKLECQQEWTQSVFRSIHSETLHCSTATRTLNNCATLPQVQTQVVIKETTCSSWDDAYMRINDCVWTICLHFWQKSLQLRVSVSLWAHQLGCQLLLAPKTNPLPSPVLASWSKPLPCHSSFWCCGTMGPVEVWVSWSIQFHKGWAAPPYATVVGKGGGEEPGMISYL